MTATFGYQLHPGPGNGLTSIHSSSSAAGIGPSTHDRLAPGGAVRTILGGRSSLPAKVRESGDESVERELELRIGSAIGVRLDRLGEEREVFGGHSGQVAPPPILPLRPRRRVVSGLEHGVNEDQLVEGVDDIEGRSRRERVGLEECQQGLHEREVSGGHRRARHDQLDEPRMCAEGLELSAGIGAQPVLPAMTGEVIVPAGLNDTYFPSDTALARPHSRLYESWFSMADPPRDFSEFDMSWVGPAASLVSTAADLNRFFGLLIGGELLQAESLAQMQRTAPVRSFEGTMIDYGLGLHRRNEAGGTFWGHDGSVWGGGAITMTRADGRRQMTILVNRQRWNELDDSGRPVPHAIDGALEHLYSLALG